MHVNELLQRVVLEALENGDYSLAEILENVAAAVERHEQHVADSDES